LSSFDVYLGPFAHGETHEEKMDRWDEQEVRRVPVVGRFPVECECGCGRVEEPGETFDTDWFEPAYAPECRDRLMADAYEAMERYGND
jgi:hypothetical protein